MTDLDKLQKLIETDPEFEPLLIAASSNTNSLFDGSANDLLETKNYISSFKKLDVEEYYAIYKVILGWCTLLGKVLKKVHGKDYKDSSAGIQISGTTKWVNIYKAPGPWHVRIYIDKGITNPETYIEECISIIDKATGNVLEDVDIEFRLTVPRAIYNPVRMMYIPDLGNSMMTISLKDEEKNMVLDHTTLAVRDFTPGRLTEFIRRYYSI